MKLLIIEDENEINEIVVQFFKSEGHTIESAKTYKAALDKVCDFEYDCIILDLNLPDGDGLDIIRKLKKDKSECCIVVISARNSLEDKIEGLELGADDYLAKPFSMSELNARIKSVVRRAHFAGSKAVEFNELKLLPDSRQLFVNGSEVLLTPKEFDILCYFFMNKNRVLTRENIVEHLWGDTMGISADSFDFIYTHIRNIRKKIASAGGKDYIHSIYSIGYKFVEE